jgi:hypothetical protein
LWIRSSLKGYELHLVYHDLEPRCSGQLSGLEDRGEDAVTRPSWTYTHCFPSVIAQSRAGFLSWADILILLNHSRDNFS